MFDHWQDVEERDSEPDSPSPTDLAASILRVTVAQRNQSCSRRRYYSSHQQHTPSRAPQPVTVKPWVGPTAIPAVT